MKKLSLLVIFALIVSVAIGKSNTSKEYNYGKRGQFVTARASYIMWDDISGFLPAASIEGIYGFSCNPWFMVGGGIGVTYSHFPKHITSMGESRGAIRIPIYLHLRTNILDRRVSPFVALNLGGGVHKGYIPLGYSNPEVENDFHIFAYGEPQIGVALRLKGGRMVDIGASVPLYNLDAGLKFGVGFTW
jgi:hypothetical protein